MPRSRLLPGPSQPTPTDAPEDSWPWWSLELESGDVVEVVGMGRCGEQSAAARLLPAGRWEIADTPEDAVAKLLGMPRADAADIFWGRA